jgi:hypothetical protein
MVGWKMAYEIRKPGNLAVVGCVYWLTVREYSRLLAFGSSIPKYARWAGTDIWARLTSDALGRTKK